MVRRSDLPAALEVLEPRSLTRRQLGVAWVRRFAGKIVEGASAGRYRPGRYLGRPSAIAVYGTQRNGAPVAR